MPLRARTLAIATLLTTGAAVTPAQAAAPQPGWRVTKTITTRYFAFAGLAAPSAKEVWTIGNPTTVLRNTGTGWRNVPLPPSLRNGRVNLLSASGPANVWVQAEVLAPDFSTVNYLVRWTGGRWAAPVRLPARTYPTALLARGPQDVWYFTETGDAVHFDGRGWRTYRIGFPVTQAHGSGSTLWAVGATSAQAPRAARWDGRAWRGARLPAVGKAWLASVTVTGPRAAWAVGTAGGRSLLLRWNGGTWSRVGSTAVRAGFTGVVPDGAGGLWLTSVGAPVHRYRAGRFTRPKVAGVKPSRYPLVFEAIARVPGTTSVWAVGGHRETKDFLDAAVFRYGR
ncbi:MAG TPA: hypothetical protein VHJ17_18195 [Thermomonospora sp.]|nr:hypothetical protein [Thermomonospora sp.]